MPATWMDGAAMRASLGAAEPAAEELSRVWPEELRPATILLSDDGHTAFVRVNMPAATALALAELLELMYGGPLQAEPAGPEAVT